MERLNQFLNIVMGCSVGVLIGHGLFRYLDYTSHPDLYAMQSAPWYTSIFVYGAVTLVMLAVCITIKILMKLRK